jgi:hypothetical protein
MSPVREAAPGARGSDARPAACPTQTGTDAVASRLASQHPLRKITPHSTAAKMAPARANAFGPPDNGRVCASWASRKAVSAMTARRPPGLISVPR